MIAALRSMNNPWFGRDAPARGRGSKPITKLAKREGKNVVSRTGSWLPSRSLTRMGSLHDLYKIVC